MEEQVEKQEGAAAKGGLAGGEGEGSAGPGGGRGDGTSGDGCPSKTGGDGNDEDGEHRNHSGAAPLAPDDSSGKMCAQKKF